MVQAWPWPPLHIIGGPLDRAESTFFSKKIKILFIIVINALS